MTDVVVPPERQKRRAQIPDTSWLLLPAIAFIALVFGWPLIYLVRMSFNIHPPEGIYVEAWSLQNYIALLTEPLHLTAIWTTVYLSLVTAVVTVIAAFFFAQLVWSQSGKTRTVLMAVALGPMLVSEVSVLIGWRIFFPTNGLLSYALVSTGLSDVKINLLSTQTAVIVGLCYISMPYCFFTILSVLNGIDRNLLTASGDLGASPVRTFFEVLVPLARGGIAAAFIQAFVFTMGIYATTNALGPDSLWTMGYEIQRQMLSRRDWPMASAIAVVLVIIVAAAVLTTQWLRHRTRSHHD